MRKFTVYGLRFAVCSFFFLFSLTENWKLVTGNCFAQSIQELESKLKSASADDKPGILNQLSEAYLQSNASKSIDYANQALNLSKQGGDINEEAGADVNLGNAYVQNGNASKSIGYYQDAIKIFNQYNQPASSAVIWNKIADAYLAAQKYADAFNADSKALDLFKKINDKNGIMNMNIDLGDICFKQKKYESSISSYKQALKMAEDSKNAKQQVTVLTRISRSYNGWGNYDETYKTLNTAFEIAKKNNLTSEANSISKNLEVAKQNMTGSKTEYVQQKEKETEQQIKTKEVEITSLSAEKMKSMEEIEQLSVEAQNKELKIKNQQEEIIRKKLEADKQAKANELLKKEKELKDVELNQQKWIIWGGVAFSILLLALIFYVFLAYRNKKKANIALTEKNEIISKQKEQIEQKNMFITDSIDYAKSIQEAILPPIVSIEKFFPKLFILYKPKDIVSGDFYWTHEINNTIFIAAADCTGHGVPGAFMSLLGFIMLNDIVKTIENASPAEILTEVNTQLMNTLHQDGEHSTGKFGMDIALIKYNKLTKELIFAGAHNPLVIINESGINELKSDKVAIGTIKTTSFNNQTVQVKEGDMIYIYSDGYPDQIGGEKRKKFLSFNMKELFIQIHTMNMDQQKSELEKKHMEWRSKTDQTDDILIIGLKV